MHEALNTYLEQQERNLCRFLQDLVRIPTVNPPGERYAECVSLLEEKLKSLGMATQVATVPETLLRETLPACADFPRLNLIGRWDVGAAKTVHFNAHYDVVPVSGQWRFGPFEPKIEGGWLYGRGSADMKGAIAACCFALQALHACGISPRVNVEVSFTADEEIGGDLGAGFVVKQGLSRADYAIVCEGGAQANVGCGHNGVLWLEVAVQGKAAHASRPHRGINAFENMAALTMELQKLKEAFSSRPFTPPSGRAMHPTLNLGGVFGVGPGAKVNTVPALATFTIDRRITPNETLREAERELRAAIRSARRVIPKFRAGVSRLLGIAPCLVNHQSPFPRAFARAVRAVRGRRTRFYVTAGFTDMHFFVVEGKMPAVGYGPKGENAHSVDERVQIGDLVETAKIYAQFLSTWEG